MKKTLLFTWLFVVCSITATLAQYEGKRFISASAGISFSNQNPEQSSASNTYGYNFNAQLGKFKTQTMARGWNLGTSLGGGKNNFYVNGTASDRGITQFGANAGYFWQYYKHFNDKFGVFGGPNLDVSYNYTKTYETSNGVSEKRTNTFSLPFGVSAGAYYTLSERWWLTGSLGFADLLSVGYSFGKTENIDRITNLKSSVFNYEFSPTITFPSVSLGIRYVFRN